MAGMRASNIVEAAAESGTGQRSVQLMCGRRERADRRNDERRVSAALFRMQVNWTAAQELPPSRSRPHGYGQMSSWTRVEINGGEELGIRGNGWPRIA